MLPCVSLVFALTLECNSTQARCIADVVNPNETDLAKAEVKRAVANSAAVFVGHVTAIEYVPARTEFGDGEMLVIRMTVRNWWKGVEGQDVWLNTANYRYSDGTMSSEAHDYPYQLGKTYLVYANATRDGLHASVCTRTKPVELATEDVAILDGLKRN